jgi:hypothetical protein
MARPAHLNNVFAVGQAAVQIPAPAVGVPVSLAPSRVAANPQPQPVAQLIGNFDHVMEYVITYIYPQINHVDLTRVLSEFNQLNDSQRFKLIRGVIDTAGPPAPGAAQLYQLSPNFVALINADRNIALWGYQNNYNDDADWKALLEELTIIQLNSIVKPDITDLFRAIRQKFRVLNRMIEIDRGIIGGPPGANGVALPVAGNRFRKYLKYKQKYLKLKNDLNNN